MKYLYENINDLIDKLNIIYVKVQPLELENKNYINLILCSATINGELHTCSIPVLSQDTELTQEKYNRLTEEELIKTFDKIKEANPKIKIIRGGIEEWL